ncbi:MAG: hypothetical protein JWN81_2633 [Solirubrobacterales bacterium]|jgi:hypothetical protein|nr:hypothetical protein [Solirubrobacterales bacterium]
MVGTETSPTEEADRLAIRELLDAYAHCAARTRRADQAAQGVRVVTFYSGRMASFPQLHRSRTSTGLTAGNIGGVD